MSIRRRAVAGALVAALLAAACSSSDPGDDDGAAGVADESADDSADDRASTTSTTSTTAAPATTAVTTTTVAGPVVADELDVIEVSARLIDAGNGEGLVLAIAADDGLAEVPLDDGGPASTPDGAGWCVAASGAGGDPELLVRLAPPAVDRSEGGLERFELVRPGPDGAGSGTVRFDLDGESFEVTGADVVVADDAATGTFRAELADGAVIEGAFRCV